MYKLKNFAFIYITVTLYEFIIDQDFV